MKKIILAAFIFSSVFSAFASEEEVDSLAVGDTLTLDSAFTDSLINAMMFQMDSIEQSFEYVESGSITLGDGLATLQIPPAIQIPER